MLNQRHFRIISKTNITKTANMITKLSTKNNFFSKLYFEQMDADLRQKVLSHAKHSTREEISRKRLAQLKLSIFIFQSKFFKNQFTKLKKETEGKREMKGKRGN